MTEQPFFLVWNPAGFGTPKHRHPDRKTAREEAERLARIAPGQSFYVLEAVSVTRKVDVETVELLDSLPF